MKKIKVDQVIIRPTLSPRSGTDYDTWFAEAYVKGCDYPVGIAFLNLPFKNTDDLAVILEQIHVVDHWQRRGVATQIVDACVGKWGFVMITGAVSRAGKGFIRHILKNPNVELY